MRKIRLKVSHRNPLAKAGKTKRLPEAERERVPPPKKPRGKKR